MKLKKKYFSPPEARTVSNLLDFQGSLKSLLGERVTVSRYYEPYKWDFYVRTEKGKECTVFYHSNFFNAK